jgi:anti-sigma factor RsiW
MTCPLLNNANGARQSALLLDYAAGRLDPAQRANLDRHIENCPPCASFRIEQTAVWDALDLWEPAPVSMDFNRRLWQRIDTGTAAPWYHSLAKSLRFTNWKPVVPLTAAMLVIAAGFVLDHPNGKTGVSGMTIKEVDQVEQTLDDIDLLHQLDAVVVSPATNSKTM